MKLLFLFGRRGRGLEKKRLKRRTKKGLFLWCYSRRRLSSSCYSLVHFPVCPRCRWGWLMGRSFTMKPLNETETTLTRSTSQMRDQRHTSGKTPTLVKNHSDEKLLGLVTLPKSRVHTDTYILSSSDFYFF